MQRSHSAQRGFGKLVALVAPVEIGASAHQVEGEEPRGVEHAVIGQEVLQRVYPLERDACLVEAAGLIGRWAKLARGVQRQKRRGVRVGVAERLKRQVHISLYAV